MSQGWPCLWSPGRSTFPASPLRPASGPEERKLGQRKLALDLTPYKEIYNQKTHCLCGAFRKQFLAWLRKRNFCGKCLLFMFLADLRAFSQHRCSFDCSLCKRRQNLCRDTGYSVCQLADRNGGPQKSKGWFLPSEHWRGEDLCFLQHPPQLCTLHLKDKFFPAGYKGIWEALS